MSVFVRGRAAHRTDMVDPPLKVAPQLVDVGSVDVWSVSLPLAAVAVPTQGLCRIFGPSAPLHLEAFWPTLHLCGGDCGGACGGHCGGDCVPPLVT